MTRQDRKRSNQLAGKLRNDKFVYTEEDMAGLTLDNSEAEGPPLGEIGCASRATSGTGRT